MRPLIRALPFVLAFTSLLTLNGHAVQMDVHNGVVSGRVVESLGNGPVAGSPGLQVKLIAPASMKRGHLVSVTNSRGEYSFAEQPRGQYLFEVYRGPVLLYRRVLDTSHDSQFTVSLRRRS